MDFTNFEYHEETHVTLSDTLYPISNYSQSMRPQWIPHPRKYRFSEDIADHHSHRIDKVYLDDLILRRLKHAAGMS